jgi:hypothetical protein
MDGGINLRGRRPWLPSCWRIRLSDRISVRTNLGFPFRVSLQSILVFYKLHSDVTSVDRPQVTQTFVAFQAKNVVSKLTSRDEPGIRVRTIGSQFCLSSAVIPATMASTIFEALREALFKLRLGEESACGRTASPKNRKVDAHRPQNRVLPRLAGCWLVDRALCLNMGFHVEFPPVLPGARTSYMGRTCVGRYRRTSNQLLRPISIRAGRRARRRPRTGCAPWPARNRTGRNCGGLTGTPSSARVPSARLPASAGIPHPAPRR